MSGFGFCLATLWEPGGFVAAAVDETILGLIDVSLAANSGCLNGDPDGIERGPPGNKKDFSDKSLGARSLFVISPTSSLWLSPSVIVVVLVGCIKL